MYNSSLKILRLLPPELSHTITINFLKYFKVRQKNIEDPILAQHLMGLDFTNPIGLAAGFDKNAEVMHSMFSFGFGFLEVGTITPQPQSGNSKPRVFRLSEDKAIINSLGFNNKGIKKVKKNLIKHQKSYLNNKIVGVNIGKNKNSIEAIDDYLIGLEELGDLASYITINISSPNTEGLRDFHDQNSLEKLLTGINKIKREKNILKPIVVKLSPDINDTEISKIIELIMKYKIDGVIVSNTTDSNRENLSDTQKNEKGGLSGQPLKNLSTELIKKFYKDTKGKFQIIGVGGVDSGLSAFEKICAGASAVQLYTGMVYKGPGVVREMKKELISILKKENLKNISEAVGINT